jgi:tetratricopeptide (TPR) repeat protein
MSDSAPLLAALVAFLVGLTIGKAWERYKLRGGKWIDRRRARESPHYILGLNFLVANQIDLAIEELTSAASVDADALEVHMILGNLYREKGQVGKAITMHQALLQRSRLSRVEHAYVLLCLGLDYKRGGFVERAFEAFTEVLGWIRQRVRCSICRSCTKNSISGPGIRHAPAPDVASIDRPQTRRSSRFSRTDQRRGHASEDVAEAIGIPSAIELGPRRAGLPQPGDVRIAQKRENGRVGKLVQVAPDRAYLAFDRLEALAVRPAPDRSPGYAGPH